MLQILSASDLLRYSTNMRIPCQSWDLLDGLHRVILKENQTKTVLAWYVREHGRAGLKSLLSHADSGQAPCLWLKWFLELLWRYSQVVFGGRTAYRCDKAKLNPSGNIYIYIYIFKSWGKSMDVIWYIAANCLTHPHTPYYNNKVLCAKDLSELRQITVKL